MLFDGVDRGFIELGPAFRVGSRANSGVTKCEARESEPEDRSDLFASLAASRRPARWRGLAISVMGHALAAALLVLVPIMVITSPAPQVDPIRVLIYDPPPPPPPPLLRGSPLARPARVRQPEPASPASDALTPPVEVPQPMEAVPAATPAPATETAGSPEGGDTGSPDGMVGGVEGGTVGGVPGGVLGGVIGGTGTGPVPVFDYDSPPRLLRRTTPEYPSEAFVKKVEGTVELELLIDAEGRLASIRVVRSIPLLDQAAIRAVRQWVFAPAIRHGRRVASLASAPIGFHIY